MKWIRSTSECVIPIFLQKENIIGVGCEISVLGNTTFIVYDSGHADSTINAGGTHTRPPEESVLSIAASTFGILDIMRSIYITYRSAALSHIGFIASLY